MKSSFKVGSLVKVTQGYDRDKLYVIKEINGHFAYLVNGLNKPLSNPKKKNLKHIQLLNGYYEFKNYSEKRINYEIHNLIKHFKS